MVCWTAPFPIKSFVAVLISTTGLYLVSGCADGTCFGSGIQVGELYLFGATLGITAKILSIRFGGSGKSAITLTLISLVVTAVVTTTLSLIIETDDWVYPENGIRSNFFFIAAAAFCEAIAMVLQVLGLQYLSATRVTLICCLQSVACELFADYFFRCCACVFLIFCCSAAVFSYWILDETLTSLEIVGAVIMFSASVLSVLPVDETNFIEYVSCGGVKGGPQGAAQGHEYTSVADHDNEEYDP